MNIKTIENEILSSILVKENLLKDKKELGKILELAKDCKSSLESQGKVILCGNGGSFADAQHLSAEFTSRFLFDRPGLASIALGTNSSSMTAIGNDYGYENVFARELESIAFENDILIGITTSGNSANILKAIEVARKKEIKIYIFSGSGQGKLPIDINVIHVPSDETARVQECHILIGHIICGLVESEIFSSLIP